ncbi:MAG: type II toxin-antitoxin system Phd/YefM family antitoxin [Pseudomonadota bacterium]|nr:type II toxin-antitoxin system Phd/YefM family antitoxin [Pseudomonadota bacterium]
MIKVAIEDLEKNIPSILQHIEAGDSFIILKGQKPLGEFRPLNPLSLPLRPYGLCAGDFIVPEDFNQSLPEDIIREYEGS